MKIRLFLLLLLSPLLAKAEVVQRVVSSNLFKEGTSWELVGGYTYVIKGETEFLGQKCLKMWGGYPDRGDSEMQLQVYLRVEDDKVYFVDSENATEWSLLYDFGMQLGDTVTVYEPEEWNSGRAKYQFGLRCVQSYWAADQSPSYFVMMFASANDDEQYPLASDAYWIKGIGAMRGPLEPTFLIQPGGNTLYKVISDGEVCYENRASAIDVVNVADETEVRINGRELTLSNSDEEVLAYIYTIDGKLISSLRVGVTPVSIELKNAGMYLISVNGHSKKIVVR